MGCSSGSDLRPLRAQDRDPPLRKARPPGDVPKALSFGAEGVLGGRQRILSPRRTLPTAPRPQVAQPHRRTHVNPCELAEPSRNLLLDRPTQGPHTQPFQLAQRPQRAAPRLPGPLSGVRKTLPLEVHQAGSSFAHEKARHPWQGRLTPPEYVTEL